MMDDFHVNVRKIESVDSLPASIHGLSEFRCDLEGESIQLYMLMPDQTVFVAQPLQFKRVGPNELADGDFLPYDNPHVTSDEFLQLMLDCAWKRGLRPAGMKAEKDTHADSSFVRMLAAVQNGFAQAAGGHLDVMNVGLFDHKSRIVLLACGGGNAFSADVRLPSGMCWPDEDGSAFSIGRKIAETILGIATPGSPHIATSPSEKACH